MSAPPRTAVTLGEMFEHQLRTRPDATAVRTSGRSWTYAEFGAETARLAHRLRRLGAGPGTVVGLVAPRGPAAVLGLWATIRAGAACLPLDPAGPPARSRDVLREAECTLVLADAAVEWLPGALLIGDPGLAGEPSTGAGLPAPAAQDLAYAITTSGSTGRPKVVGVPHEGIVNLIVACRDELDLIRPEDVLLWTAEPTVDVSMQDCLMTLACGAAIATSAPGAPQAMLLVRDARALGATVLDLPSAVVGPYGRSLLPRLAAAGVRLVITGSSQLDGRGLADAAGDLVVHNGYGPTEASVAATWYVCDSTTPQRAPIGKPYGGVRIHLLDEDLRPVPDGEVGQIYIAGRGLARGYLGLPSRTASAFLPDPFSDEPGRRMYATGDRATVDADGNYVYLGRMDDQVKINGFRVEIGEVEHALRGFPGVTDAAVLVHPRAPGGTALVSYLSGTPSPDEALVEYLRDHLPGHMIPRFHVWLAEMPLNRPGKVDRTALAGIPIGDSLYRAGGR
ncbi:MULTISPECIES: amino acid adenylation domain-containing protein [Catenuloplanes]|uniref:Amino acid adenylation domain-containing protein n=1 Tax=Catenuloplanes niger TaxID=587534 RepID=A0AAE3ZZJ1_9ACTN|nr:amino acid adenylation domain-containing protein [Catenuloplanes niger]MDR7326813.1 amino acid adenylation domain-containing protein [Catenuloplanes niger]